MIISNLKSSSDLDRQRKLQQELLDLEVANEAELERRVKDYKDPNKPLPVAPQFRTNAELRKDRIEQERQALKNADELGFDYKKSADIVAWLSSSEVDKLVEFNANFKGIKKELTETTNPKLLTTEYLKNYLERYFEDLDVSFGRKFPQQTQRDIPANLSIDELIAIVPQINILDELANQLLQIQENLRRDMNVLYTQINGDAHNYGIADRLRDETNAGQRNAYQREIEAREREYSKIQKVFREGMINIQLVKLYASVLPDNSFFTTLKLALPQQLRTDLVRRYAKLLERIKALNAEGAIELLDEARNAGNFDRVRLLYTKIQKALSFISSNKNIDVIQSLNRNYETEIEKMGKMEEFDKLKKFNDINEEKTRLAKVQLEQVLKGQLPVELGNLAQEVEARAEIQGEQQLAPIRAEQALARAEQSAREAERLAKVEQDFREETRRAIEGRRPEAEAIRAKFEADRAKKALEDHFTNMVEYYRNFFEEIEAISSPNARVATLRAFLDQLGISYRDIKITQKPPAQLADEFLRELRNWVVRERIEPNRNNVNFDFENPRQRATIYTSGGRETANTTIRGVGLKKKLKEHFKDDEAELMEMAKALKKHSKKEKMIDAYAESSEDDEVGVGFKHKRIKIGKGIKAEKKPNYKTFGKYVIHMGHLIDKNIANFKYPSLGSIPSIKPMAITDDYKEFILDTLENEKPNERILRKLPIEEQKHFEKVVAGAGLLDTFKLRRIGEKDEKEQIERFNLLRGEILAGNNNETMIKELRGMVVKFMNDGRIRRQEGTNMLMELSVI